MKCLNAKRFAAVFFIFMLALMVGCSSNDSTEVSNDVTTDGSKVDAGSNQAETPPKAEPRKPVTIRMFNYGHTSDASFAIMKAGVEKAFPHITFEMVKNADGTRLEELITAGDLPDVFYGKIMEDQGVVIDLQPLIEKHNFDMNRIDPRIIEAFRYLTNSDKTLFIPWHANMQVLYYNKGLFDRFGVDYPTDGMTWDETYELARKLPRLEDGVQYLGYNMSISLGFTQTQLPLPYYDEKTGKAAHNSDGWKKYYDNFSRFFQVPGNEMTDEVYNSDGLFYKEQRVAMHAARPIFPQLVEAEQSAGLNWDLVSLPYFPEAPKQATSPNTNGFGITVTSKHKDDAFLAITAMLSEEVQVEKDRQVVLGPVLVDKDAIMKEFGKGIGLEGKNIMATVYNEFAPSRKPNPYNLRISTRSYKYFKQVARGEMDANSALLLAAEEANQIIDEVNATLK